MSAYLPRTTICETCGGKGYVTEFRRFAGEYMAGEPVEVRCQDCDGTGEQDACCSECGGIEPLNDEGECERCHDKHELTLAAFNAKWGEPLTRCEGDPLLKKDAA